MPSYLAASPAARQTPTFSKDVAPILYKNCLGCHRPGEIASAVPLVSYDDAKHRATSIRDQVQKRTMPPWPADPAHSAKFSNDARLAQQDIDTLVAWVDAGAPQGRVADLPPLPASPQGWAHPGGRAPDVVVSLPEFSVRATGEVPYIQLKVRVPLTEDKWIAAMQVRPGNRALVHHMAIAEVAMPEGVGPDDVASFDKMARELGLPSGAFATARPVVVDPENPAAYDMLGVYTPGTTFETYGEGNAKLLKGGKNLYINFNVHYTTTGKPEKDLSQLAFWFQAEPPKHQLYRVPAPGKTLIANGRQLLTDDPGTKAEGTDVAIPPIPPYTENYELIGMTAYTRPVTIYQFQPHAHLRGKDFRYAVVYPDGREETVLTVPQYDFHWQLAYELETPLKLPAGSKLIVTAHYDNSNKNQLLREMSANDPERNCGPEKQAYFRNQNQSWDEMFTPIIQYSVDSENPTQPTHDPPRKSENLNLVQAVGCVVQNSSKMWMLTHAGSPEITKGASTSQAELNVAKNAPLGNHQYALLGVDAFNPGSHGGQKVAVKGVLIGNAMDRLNVTSLQPVGPGCD